MLAFVQNSKDERPQTQSIANPEPLAGEVLIQISAASINHRDVYISQGLYAKIAYPVVFGSDGAGMNGQREVIINPGLYWGDNPHFSSPMFQILGMPRQGTLAESICIPSEYVYDKPLHLSSEEAAALPLAGVTAYRALFSRGRLQAGERILITGIGGGVALFLMQFALAAGAEVWVTSGSEDKISRAMALGAKGGVNYRDENWAKSPDLNAGFDLIVDSAGGEGFGHLLKLARPGGRIVTFGGTRGMVPNFSPQIVFWKQLDILGSTMGTPEEFGAMLHFVNAHRIHPIIDSIYSLADAAAALTRMESGEQFGKICITI
jgi:zinc-binding alcohol dehydrogenase/oxidoreductase